MTQLNKKLSIAAGLLLAAVFVVTCSNPMGSASKNDSNFHPGVATPVLAFTKIVTDNDGPCAILNGGVQCFARSALFNLGDGTAVSKDTPVDATGLTSGITDLASGGVHSCAIKDGGLWCWGRSLYGDLGNGNLTNNFVPSPTLVSGFSSGVTRVALGNYHTCALKNGSLYCWGLNNVRQLGDNTLTNSATPILATAAPSPIDDISAGIAHTCVLSNGSVYCWGQGSVGQLGNGSTVNHGDAQVPTGMDSGVTLLKTSLHGNCAVKSGVLYCWGSNSSGELGLGTTTTQENSPSRVVNLSGSITGMATGTSHACAIEDGGVKCWGSNSQGQLGNGTTTSSSTPVSVTGLSAGVTSIGSHEDHTCAVKDSHVYCWGYIEYPSNRATVANPGPLTPMQVPNW